MALLTEHFDDVSPRVTISLALLALIVWGLFQGRRRYPDAPWLRVSTKPGLLGRLSDRETYMKDQMAILNVGWERYSKHGLNYMLDTPEGPRYVVAQKYFEELVRAPDTHVSALVASNVVSEEPVL